MRKIKLLLVLLSVFMLSCTEKVIEKIVPENNGDCDCYKILYEKKRTSSFNNAIRWDYTISCQDEERINRWGDFDITYEEIIKCDIGDPRDFIKNN